MEHQPFHAGELEVQEKLGVKEKVALYAPRMIRDFMPDQHREFFEKLPFVILGGLDSKDNVWATMMAGNPGFVNSPDDTHLDINAELFLADPLLDGFRENSKVGFLGIEPATRRRNRMNGRVKANENGQLGLIVEQSYGNCPQYIHKRDIEITRGSEDSLKSVKTGELTAAAKQTIQAADMFFIASRSRDLTDDPTTGLDVSHRGGLPGFVQIVDDTTIRIPDYSGNRIYNTIGNIISDGRVGLFFIDYEKDALLYISGQAKIIWDEDVKNLPKEIERMIEVECKEVVQNFGAVKFSENLIEPSPIFRRFNTA
jgi:predicted pyridoxine 5'-phosphate oxidase superfamily flavin-nucleotide-binding protein